MKKILFSGSMKNYNDYFFCENLTQYLSSNQFNIHFLGNKQLNLDGHNFKQINNISEFDYDLVIAYNRTGYQKVKEISNTIPLFYICSGINYYNEHIDIYEYDKQFVLGKKHFTVDDNISSYINTLFNDKYNPNDDGSIVVAINSVNIINKLTPFINAMLSENIYLLSVMENIRNINFNPNIRIIKRFEKLNELFNSAKLVIGEGQSAIRGILMEIPVLVLGSFGYGGIVNKDNIDLLFQNGFSGRNGGVRDEHLPFDLIEYDLNEAYKITKEELRNLKKHLKRLIIKEHDILIENINYYSKLKEQSQDDIRLVKNELYDLISTSSSNIYYLKNRITNQFLYELSKEEASFIQFFKEGSSLSDFYSNKPKIKISNSLFKDMVSLKVLVYEK